MIYKHDSDLEFLKELKSGDLDDLVYCLTHDMEGQLRYTEKLTTSDDYKAYYPSHNKYWKLIAAEIQCFGANSFTTILRGNSGVEYKEILAIVCSTMNVNYNKHSSAENIEINLLMKILADAIENMTPEELKALAESTGVKNSREINPEAMTHVFWTIFQMGRVKSYQLTLVIVNAAMKAFIGRELPFSRCTALARTSPILATPINRVITSLWAAIDVIGPAYRVTIPAVIQVTVLRQKYLHEKHAETKLRRPTNANVSVET